MTRKALPLAALVLLLLPAGAVAKEVVKVELCGQDGCYTWDWANSRGKLVLFDSTDWASAPAPPAGPWYRMRVSVAGEMVKPFTVTNDYVPAADSIRQRAAGGGDEWVEVIDDLKPVLRNESARLEPFPAASLRGAAVAAPQPPAARPEPPAAPDAGLAWGWIATAFAAAALVAVARRRRHIE